MRRTVRCNAHGRGHHAPFFKRQDSGRAETGHFCSERKETGRVGDAISVVLSQPMPARDWHDKMGGPPAIGQWKILKKNKMGGEKYFLSIEWRDERKAQSAVWLDRLRWAVYENWHAVLIVVRTKKGNLWCSRAKSVRSASVLKSRITCTYEYTKSLYNWTRTIFILPQYLLIKRMDLQLFLKITWTLPLRLTCGCVKVVIMFRIWVKFFFPCRFPRMLF